ncbi:MAG: ferredoxin, partial [Ignisphaera sp.]
MIDEGEVIREAILDVAKLMAVAAKTSPKARGVDNIVIKVVDKREELEMIASKMDELSKVYGEFFSRDAQNVRNSTAVVLIGCRVAD